MKRKGIKTKNTKVSGKKTIKRVGATAKGGMILKVPATLANKLNSFVAKTPYRGGVSGFAINALKEAIA